LGILNIIEVYRYLGIYLAYTLCFLFLFLKKFVNISQVIT